MNHHTTLVLNIHQIDNKCIICRHHPNKRYVNDGLRWVWLWLPSPRMSYVYIYYVYIVSTYPLTLRPVGLPVSTYTWQFFLFFWLLLMFNLNTMAGKFVRLFLLIIVALCVRKPAYYFFLKINIKSSRYVWVCVNNYMKEL